MRKRERERESRAYVGLQLADLHPERNLLLSQLRNLRHPVLRQRPSLQQLLLRLLELGREVKAGIGGEEDEAGVIEGQ